jgi:hypothetical protein
MDEEKKSVDNEPVIFKCITCNYPDCIHLLCELEE